MIKLKRAAGMVAGLLVVGMPFGAIAQAGMAPAGARTDVRRLDEARAYFDSVQRRLQAYSIQVDALGAAPRNTRPEMQKGYTALVEEMRQEVKQTREAAERLRTATADQWVNLHDEIEDRFARMTMLYDRAAARMALMKAPASEPVTEVVIVGVTVRAPTPYARHVLQRLELFENRVNALQLAGQRADSGLQEETREAAKDIREKIRDTAERARDIATVRDQGEWAELHDDIESAFRDLSTDYAQAAAGLRRAGIDLSQLDGVANQQMAPEGSFASQALARLEDLEQRINALALGARNAPADVREDIRDASESMQERIGDTKERARALTRARNADKAAELRGDITNQLNQLEKDYREARTLMGRQGASRTE